MNEHPDHAFERRMIEMDEQALREEELDRAARHTPALPQLGDRVPGESPEQRYERRVEAVQAVLRQRLPGWRDASLRRVAEEVLAAADTGI